MCFKNLFPVDYFVQLPNMYIQSDSEDESSEDEFELEKEPVKKKLPEKLPC